MLEVDCLDYVALLGIWGVVGCLWWEREAMHASGGAGDLGGDLLVEFGQTGSGGADLGSERIRLRL